MYLFCAAGLACFLVFKKVSRVIFPFCRQGIRDKRAIAISVSKRSLPAVSRAFSSVDIFFVSGDRFLTGSYVTKVTYI